MTLELVTKNGDLPRLLLWKSEVAQMIGVSVRTFDRMTSSGEFPAPDKVVRGRRTWKTGSVERWIESHE